MSTEDRTLDTKAEDELKAMEAGLAGRPVDAEFAEFAELAADLKAGRPKPDEVFAAELDRAVADGFPPEWSDDAARRPDRGLFGRIAERFGGRREALAPLATAAAGLLVVVVAAGITLGDGRSGPGADGAADSSAVQSPTADGAASAESGAKALSADLAIPSSQGRLGIPAIPAQAGSAAGVENRRVARDVKITLATPPEDLQETSNRIVEVADSYNGIVMRSSVSDGDDGNAGARFTLMIPSGRVEAAVAELSGVADLRSRSQQAVDVTAPTLSTRDRLKTARARVESLLVELAGSETEEARVIVERRLRNARRTVSFLSTRLERLDRQVALTPVNVVVEAEDGSGSGVSGWDLGDAIEDAGNLLAISAGVALIALAIAIPVGLMVLVALAINRAWLRRSRDRALKEG
jgi:hypothetical protein